MLDFSDLHIQKKARKRSRSFTVTVDAWFDGVVEGCREQHGENWLYPPLVAAFRELHCRGQNGVGVGATEGEEERVNNTESSPVKGTPLSIATQASQGGSDSLPLHSTDSAAHLGRMVRVHTFEVWHEGELMAGEVGYTVGRSFTSMSGFSRMDSSGTVQCVATAKLLQALGYVWGACVRCVCVCGARSLCVCVYIYM